jgi:hypothetical protein
MIWAPMAWASPPLWLCHLQPPWYIFWAGSAHACNFPQQMFQFLLESSFPWHLISTVFTVYRLSILVLWVPTQLSTKLCLQYSRASLACFSKWSQIPPANWKPYWNSPISFKTILPGSYNNSLSCLVPMLFLLLWQNTRKEKILRKEGFILLSFRGFSPSWWEGHGGAAHIMAAQKTENTQAPGPKVSDGFV